MTSRRPYSPRWVLTVGTAASPIPPPHGPARSQALPATFEIHDPEVPGRPDPYTGKAQSDVDAMRAAVARLVRENAALALEVADLAAQVQRKAQATLPSDHPPAARYHTIRTVLFDHSPCTVAEVAKRLGADPNGADFLEQLNRAIRRGYAVVVEGVMPATIALPPGDG